MKVVGVAGGPWVLDEKMGAMKHLKGKGREVESSMERLLWMTKVTFWRLGEISWKLNGFEKEERISWRVNGS